MYHVLIKNNFTITNDHYLLIFVTSMEEQGCSFLGTSFHGLTWRIDVGCCSLPSIDGDASSMMYSSFGPVMKRVFRLFKPHQLFLQNHQIHLRNLPSTSQLLGYDHPRGAWHTDHRSWHQAYQNLHSSSCHPHHCKNGVAYRQAPRFCCQPFFSIVESYLTIYIWWDSFSMPQCFNRLSPSSGIYGHHRGTHLFWWRCSGLVMKWPGALVFQGAKHTLSTYFTGGYTDGPFSCPFLICSSCLRGSLRLWLVHHVRRKMPENGTFTLLIGIKTLIPACYRDSRSSFISPRPRVSVQGFDSTHCHWSFIMMLANPIM